MIARTRHSLGLAILTAGLCASSGHAEAQALQTRSAEGMPIRPGGVVDVPATPVVAAQLPGAAVSSKPSPGAAVTASGAKTNAGRSMLDEPAAPAQIQISGNQLSIHATNASLSEVIRQVAAQTGMQVEGNSRDQRVFGIYGPGGPPDVLSALLYDSGYNVVMVGRTADGAPRRLVLSARGAGSASQGAAAPTRPSDEDEEEAPQEALPAPVATPNIQPTAPAAPGQARTPQQMLEELQRMHQGQQAPEIPKSPNPD